MRGSREQRSARPLPKALRWSLLIGSMLAASIALQTCVMRSYSVPTGSMEPTLERGDRIAVDLLGPRLAGVRRGDVVTFTDPGGWIRDAPVTTLVKRVIGLPGDHVACCDAEGRITVDGAPLGEPYLAHGEGRGTASSEFDVVVPRGKLWVMGDNRARSADSRGRFGETRFVPIESVTGRAVLIIWPGTRWGPIQSAQPASGE